MKFYHTNQTKNILTVNFFEFLASELSVCESGTLIPKLLLLLVGVEGAAGVAFGIFISTKKSETLQTLGATDLDVTKKRRSLLTFKKSGQHKT